MPRRPCVTLLLFALFAAGSLAISGCECMYGGPGCEPPVVTGICDATIPIGQSIATLSYGDDTGLHPSDYLSVDAFPTDVLVATRGPNTGEIELDARATGRALLLVTGPEGYASTQTFGYSVTIVDPAAPESTDTTSCLLVANAEAAR